MSRTDVEYTGEERIVSQQHTEGSAQQVQEINVKEAWQRVSASGESPTPVLIDVRETWEYGGGHAKGAVNIPLSQLEQRQGEVPRDREVLCICQVGGRSLVAAQFLRQRGVERVVNVGGGTEEWVSQGLPME